VDDPAFVRLMTGYGKASLSGWGPNAVQSQVGRLAKLAATNPEFSEPIEGASADCERQFHPSRRVTAR
jgi:hypothetical protein